MKLEQSFEVQAPADRVWAMLTDLASVAPCLPGAAITGRNDDGSYNGTFKVKIGPTSAVYSGKLSMQEVDEQGHTATMDAQGTDKRGQGGAKAAIASKLSAVSDQATLVEVVTDYHITGRLARFGRGGMIEDISNRLLGEFATCLQTSLARDPSAAGAGSAPEPEPTVEVEGEGEQTPSEPASGSEEPTAATTSTETAGATDGRPSTMSRSPSPVGQMPPPESEPVQGLSLMVSVLWSRAKRNPAPVAALLFGFLLAVRVFRRRN